jgi:hypothetical protein
MSLGSVGIDPAPRCQQCGWLGDFGYRFSDGKMRWYCAEHRLAQYWADARMPLPFSNKSRGEPTDDSAHQQADSTAAERAGKDLSIAVDGPSWDRPNSIMDCRVLLRPDGPRSRPGSIAVDRTPLFDEAGRLIHPCCKCGRDGDFGLGVSLRAGQLGTWFCATCKPLGRQSALNLGEVR